MLHFQSFLLSPPFQENASFSVLSRDLESTFRRWLWCQDHALWDTCPDPLPHHISHPTLHSPHHKSNYTIILFCNCLPLECKLDNGRSHACIYPVPSEDGHIVGAQRMFVGSVNTLQESKGYAPETATSFSAPTSPLAGLKGGVQVVWGNLARSQHLQLTALRPHLSNDPSVPIALG